MSWADVGRCVGDGCCCINHCMSGETKSTTTYVNMNTFNNVHPKVPGFKVGDVFGGDGSSSRSRVLCVCAMAVKFWWSGILPSFASLSLVHPRVFHTYAHHPGTLIPRASRPLQPFHLFQSRPRRLVTTAQYAFCWW